MSRILCSLVASGLLLGASSNAAAGSTSAQDEACSAAEVAFEKMMGGATAARTVLNDRVDSGQIKLWVGSDGYDLQRVNPPVEGEEVEPPRWFAVAPSGEVSSTRPTPPAAATINAFVTAQLFSVSRCDVVRQDAAARGVHLQAPPGADRVDRRTGLYAYRSMTVSVPVLSPDGTEALTYVGGGSGPLAGGGFLWLLRRDPGGVWEVAAWLALWVS
ncbi:hypothetical protein [Caulobacter sp. LARHSG274]